MESAQTDKTCWNATNSYEQNIFTPQNPHWLGQGEFSYPERFSRFPLVPINEGFGKVKMPWYGFVPWLEKVLRTIDLKATRLIFYTFATKIWMLSPNLLQNLCREELQKEGWQNVSHISQFNAFLFQMLSSVLLSTHVALFCHNLRIDSFFCDSELNKNDFDNGSLFEGKSYSFIIERFVTISLLPDEVLTSSVLVLLEKRFST